MFSLASLASPFQIELVPNEIPEGTTLYFGAMDFVMDRAFTAQPKSKARICKCVVWDFDRTLWDGILVEDGPEQVKLKPKILDI